MRRKADSPDEFEDPPPDNSPEDQMPARERCRPEEANELDVCTFDDRDYIVTIRQTSDKAFAATMNRLTEGVADQDDTKPP